MAGEGVETPTTVTQPLAAEPETPDVLADDRAALAKERADVQSQMTSLAQAFTPEVQSLIELQRAGKTVNVTEGSAAPAAPAGPSTNVFDDYERILSAGSDPATQRRALEAFTRRFASGIEEVVAARMKPIEERFEKINKSVDHLSDSDGLNEFVIRNEDIGGGLKSSAIRAYIPEMLKAVRSGRYGPRTPWTTVARDVMFDKVADKGRAGFLESVRNAENASVPGPSASGIRGVEFQPYTVKKGEKKTLEGAVRHHAGRLGILERMFGK